MLIIVRFSWWWGVWVEEASTMWLIHDWLSRLQVLWCLANVWACEYWSAAGPAPELAMNDQSRWIAGSRRVVGGSSSETSPVETRSVIRVPAEYDYWVVGLDVVSCRVDAESQGPEPVIVGPGSMVELRLPGRCEFRDLIAHLAEQLRVSGNVQSLLFHHLLQTSHNVLFLGHRQDNPFHAFQAVFYRVFHKELSDTCLVNVERTYVGEFLGDEFEILYHISVFCSKRELFHVDEFVVAVLLLDHSSDSIVSLLA